MRARGLSNPSPPRRRGPSAFAFFATLSMATIAVAQARNEIDRGRYLATAADCVACHTKAEGEPFAGGRPIRTPFGTIYSRNLTPDVDTGIGAWSDDEFYRAVHDGIRRDGKQLYPAFPYTYFTKIPRDDVLAIRAYLRTLPAVRNEVPTPALPWPLRWRGSVAIWKKLYFRPGAQRVGNVDAASGDRGAYLAEALGHCGACHTPKSALMADRPERYLQGGELLGWHEPNLAADARSGLGAWSEDEIVEFLATGRNARALAGGPMAEVVEFSTSRLEHADLEAIAHYLKRVEPRAPGSAPAAPDAAAMRRGEAIFVDACAGCHRTDGSAAPRAFAPLAGSASVQAASATSVVRVILDGVRVAATDAQPAPFAMQAFGWKLDDAEVADVATYVRNAWGNRASGVDAGAVAKLRAKIAKEHEDRPIAPP